MHGKNSIFEPWVLVMLTNKCNLQCKLCNIWKEKEKDINLLKLYKVISLILQNLQCISCLGITGGEPFIKEELLNNFFKSLYLYILRGKIKHFNITTNGTLPLQVKRFVYSLSDEFLERMSFNVSLDGLESTHNYLRGKPVFWKVLETIRILVKRGIDTTVNFVINPFNASDIYSVYTLSKKIGCNVEFEIFSENTPSYYHYNSKINIKEKDPNWKEICKEEIEKIFEDKQPICNINQLKVLYEYLSNGQVKKEIAKKCCTPSKLIFIRATGEIYSCPHAAPLGNIENFNWDEFTKNRIKMIKKINYHGCKGCLSTMGALNYVL